MTTNNYEWIDYYKELGTKLLKFKDCRQDLVGLVKKVYENTQLPLPTLEKDNANITDIDPFTVYGLFNKNSLKNENRIKITTELGKLLSMKSPAPTNFADIPVVNNKAATYYYFADKREGNDIDDLWELFELAMLYSFDQTKETAAKLANLFDIVIAKKGIGNSKITMGLFWMNPDVFINLDARNVWYLYESGSIPTTVVEQLPKLDSKMTAAHYFEIRNQVGLYINRNGNSIKSFSELSAAAYAHSTAMNNEKKLSLVMSTSNEKGSGLADEDVESTRYWIYSPGEMACMWDAFYENGVMGLGFHELGDLTQYPNKKGIINSMKQHYGEEGSYRNGAHAAWQFANEMKQGDVVFVKKGIHQVIGRGIVESDYTYDDTIDEQFPNLRCVKWTHKGLWDHPGSAASKTLTDITIYTEYLNELFALFEDGEKVDPPIETVYPPYSKEKYLEEVFMSESEYTTLVDLIKAKKNVILQGAPGVGKTYAAKRLAYSMMNSKDQERVMMVQFHQSYSYEDLIEGYRPTESGFKIHKGALYNFCLKAANDLENEYFFIIDEINRGNLSKIFGELFMLIENDKRGNALHLLYSNDKFSVPSNVYFIGMMNTADRGLALLDYALRRRFAFYEMKPGFGSKGFIDYKMNKASKKFDSLVNCVQNLNNAIAGDDALGEGFCIGHSYFCNLEELDDKKLSNIIEYELIPLLKEYWFDEPSKVHAWSSSLRGSIA